MICSVWIQKWIQFWIILLVFAVKSSLQHARLMEPPSRASMWRVGFPTPRDVDDNQSYCGGYGVQYGSNGGNYPQNSYKPTPAVESSWGQRQVFCIASFRYIALTSKC